MKKALVKLFLFTLIFQLFLISIPNTSYACSCMMPGPPEEELQKVDAVFSGKVIDIKEPKPNSFGEISSVDNREVLFEVYETWKGVNQTEVLAYTALHEASCGYNFQLDGEYLVYAYKDDLSINVSLCSATKSLNDASADLQALGPGEKPEKEVNVKMRRENSNTITYIMIGAIVTVSIGGVLILRKMKS